MHNQIHSEGAVRHAEKRRRGTCEFANRIARISLETYQSAVPESHRKVQKQTCVAAIVASFQEVARIRSINDEPNRSDRLQHTEDTISSYEKLQVMGLGVGTKFLSAHTLQDELQYCTPYGNRIRDSHAEVLARRAFKRQLLEEIWADLQGASFKVNNDYIPILERVGPNQYDNNETSDESKVTQNTSKRLRSGFIADHDKNIRYKLKDGVTLHFYASSAPCGNATLKKFVKMEKEVFDMSLGPNQWPQQLHSSIAAHSLRLGQFALLVKKDGSTKSDNAEEQVDYTVPPQHLKTANMQQKTPRAKTWPYHNDDAWCPPSCSIANFNKGTIHSCSDKICRWNCLGMQGSLLMILLEDPLYMTTLTVGRKFSRAICQRAVCCRAEGFQSRNGASKYRLNHPALMETNVYMDETGTHSMEGIKAIGQDASFDSSNSCWVWWPVKASHFGCAECIDGKTGFVINHDDTAVTPPLLSGVSTSSMLEMLRCIGLSHISSTLSLEELMNLKRKTSPDYQAAKDDLIRHRVFQEWCCRYR
ncbi:hypothetical protein ACHAWX_004939 [Stephanocyclus meneghinianus]